MEQLVEVALLGTGRRELPRANDEVGSLAGALPDIGPEQRLLLQAGALAVYSQAGIVPSSGPAPPPPAPEEHLPACSPALAAIIRDMLRQRGRNLIVDQIAYRDQEQSRRQLYGEHEELIPELAVLMERAGLRVPIDQLHRVLLVKSPEARRAVLPILGERGRWLAGFNPDWSWVLNPPLDPETATQLPPDADRIWEEGTIEEREALLRLHRRIDPVAARGRLEEVFPAENVETRVELVRALKVGLSADDEPFLESVLNDRSAQVRRYAALLLAHLPDSDCSRRLWQRAGTMLSWRSRRLRADVLEVTPPERFDSAWKREGIEQKSGTPAQSQQGFWLEQHLSLLPARGWAERFGQPFESLVKALDGEYQMDVLEGWTAAALEHGEDDLLSALWDGWWQRRHLKAHFISLLPARLAEMAGRMPLATLEERMSRLFDDASIFPVTILGRIVRGAPVPWPKRAADTYVERTLRQISNSLIRNQNPPEPWLYTLEPASRALPPTHLEAALAALPDLPEPRGPQLREWHWMVNMLAEKLRIRQRYLQEFKHDR